MNGHDNRASLERMIQAMFRGDFETAVSFLDPEGIVEWPQSGERIVGPIACLAVYRNYPGGPPSYRLRRISGEGEHFVVEATADYGGHPVLAVTIVEFRDGKVVKQIDYWSDPFEAPDWRAGWVEKMEAV